LSCISHPLSNPDIFKTMSVTTTDNPITLSLQQTLGDYEVHVTGNNRDTSREIKPPNASNTAPVAENPPSWPQDHHRIPHHRPVNRELNWSQRPLGVQFGEQVFLHVMFTGVSLNAVRALEIDRGEEETDGLIQGVAQLWGATGGKIFTKVFKYAIGGEW
jgi:hypothetical protein